MKRGTLYVISAPSGCGKNTIISRMREFLDFFLSVSATTRLPRPGEADGVNYHFISNEAFEEMMKAGDFLEYAGYVNNYYGTPKAPVEEHLAAGKDVVLEIDVVGAMKVRKLYPDSVNIFILPPSLTVLEERLRKRGTETEDVIQERVAQATREIRMADQYDYLVINDDLDDALADVRRIIDIQRLVAKQNLNLIEEVLRK